MKKIVATSVIGTLLLSLFLLTGCGQAIPSKSTVASYLKKTYGIKKFDIVDTGYNYPSLDGSKGIQGYGYVKVSVDGVEFKVSTGFLKSLSDDYLTSLIYELNFNKYASDKYGTLPSGVRLEASLKNTDMSKLRHFPITYDELIENSEIDISFRSKDFTVLRDNLQTLIDLRVRANMVDATVLNLNSAIEDFRVLEDGRIISSATAIGTKRYNGVEYPYIDDDIIQQLHEEELQGKNKSETTRKFQKRIDEIKSMYAKIGYK